MQFLFGDADLDSRLFDLGQGAFRLRWDRVFNHLGLSTREADGGITPGCMRGSGATFLYNETENIPLIRWRGRWRREATLEAYLQDVASLMFLANATPDCRARVAELASLALPVISAFMNTSP